MNEQIIQPMSRREFVSKSAILATSAIIAPGLLLYVAESQAKPPEMAVTSKTRWGMLVDTAQCKEGCNDCIKTCHEHNGIQSNGRPASDPQWIRKVTIKDKQTGKQASLPIMCQHCEHPPCVDVCPTGASFRRVDGIVLVDRHICIGCRYCMMACPYKARSFVHESVTDQRVDAPRGKGTVEACNFCVKKVDNGELPACVDACNKAGHQALIFGDLNDPNSELSKRLMNVATVQLRADLNLNNGVRYQGI